MCNLIINLAFEKIALPCILYANYLFKFVAVAYFGTTSVSYMGYGTILMVYNVIKHSIYVYL